jgi:hypothetical protein
MAKPIKTLLLDEVKKNIITVIGDAARVFIDPSRGLREELVSQNQYSNVFTYRESFRKENLYSQKTFDMEIHTWVKADTDDKAREKAIILDANIQEQILPLSSSVRKYCQYFEEQNENCSDILYYSEGLCVVVSRYQVKYRHAYGKPTQQNP